MNKQAKKKRSSKTVYVPHKDKPAQVVDKRNARERRRVEAVSTRKNTSEVYAAAFKNTLLLFAEIKKYFFQ